MSRILPAVTESAQNVAEVSIAQSSHNDGMSETVISIAANDLSSSSLPPKAALNNGCSLSSTPDELAHGIKSAVSYCPNRWQ